jgi:DSF synthase
MAGFAEAVPKPGAHSLIPFGSGSRRGAGDERGAAQPDYENLDVRFETAAGIYWCYLNPVERPSFTLGLLRDLSLVQQSFTRMFAAARRDEPPIRYVVVDSHTPGIFNLGGDLLYFSELIRSQDRERLREYGRACVGVIYQNAIAYDLPLITIALVRGDALGGGFEAALTFDILVAEKGAKFGLPEILFNLFPGMGAYNLLERKIGAARAEQMILSGHIYTAEELHAMNLVHVLAEPGEGEAAVRDYIRRHGRRHQAQAAIYNVGRTVRPIVLSELLDVVDIWVETALKLQKSDLRKMERLAAAQGKRGQGSATALAG